MHEGVNEGVKKMTADLTSCILGAGLCILGIMMAVLGASLLTAGVVFFGGLALVFNPRESRTAQLTHSALFGVAVLLLLANLVTTLSA
jgi:hypothetical protein